MPYLERPDGCKLYYEEQGSGIPVLFLAPGGMTSQIGNWGGLYNPLTALPQSQFRLIAMDQRTAGKSTGPFALNGGLMARENEGRGGSIQLSVCPSP